MKPVTQVVVDDKTGFYVLDILVERWKATPKMFPFDQRGAIIPQTIIPERLRNNTEKLFNFYWLICLYMRGGIESLQAFRAMIKLWEDHPELFDPFHAQHVSEDELQPIIATYVGWDSHNVAKFWIENSKRLVRNWDGRASNLFRGVTDYAEATRRIRNKRNKREWHEACKVDDRGEGFMGFQPKMVSMLVYFIDWEGLLDKPFVYPTPADFHNFRLALAHRILVIEPEPETLRASELISKPWRDLTVRYLKARPKVTPVELADCIWLFSLTLCGASPLTDFHEREDRNGHGMFDPRTLPHTSTPDFMATKFRERLKRTCLACPIIDSCELAIPAGPYYQRRGDRGIAFGGQLYLLPRHAIEQHLPTFPVDYLALDQATPSEAPPEMFDDLHEHRAPPRPTELPQRDDDDP